MTWGKRRALVIGFLILFFIIVIWAASKPARLPSNAVLVIDADGEINEQRTPDFFAELNGGGTPVLHDYLDAIDAARVATDRMSVDDLAARACEEVQTLGHLDEACVKLLCALMREETRRFTVLRPPGGWHRDVVEGLVSEFFVKKVEMLTAELVTIGVTPRVVGKVMRRWIRNFLVDRARDTPLGRIRRKLEEDMLRQYPEFLRVPPGEEGAGRWYLAGHPSYPYGGSFAPLIEAAYAVPGVKAVRWSGSRRPPLTSNASLRAIVAAVLTAAGGSLEVAQLVHVVAQRFPAAVEPEDVTIDDDTFDRVAHIGSDDPSFALDTEESIRAVLDQLSPSQRALVPYLDRDIKVVAEMLNVGRSRAYEAVKHVKGLLDRLLPDDDTRAIVYAALVERCGAM